MRFFDFENKCSKRTSMRLWIAPSFRSRRAVQKDGPHLSVAYDLTCFIRFFDFEKKCSKSLSCFGPTVNRWEPPGVIICRKHLDLSLVNDCLNIIWFTKMNKRSRKV